MIINLKKTSRQATIVIFVREIRMGQIVNNKIAISCKQKQIRLMFCLKFSWIGKLLKI